MIQTTDIFTLTLNQWESRPDISYDDLVIAVKNVHQFSYQAAVKAINRYATMRNWLIGFFIVEYQQKGQDRAAYGERLLKNLENTLQTRGLNVTLFQNCRLFYACYPQVADLFEVKIQPAALVKSETVGMSADPKDVMASLPRGNSSNALDIRQPFTFEFLGLKATELLKESDIEEALLIHLQEFLMEMGKGFCFEARQKRIIIDDEYYFADLVFYHRILHCSIIVELKNDEFHHEHLGQLNAYVSYYRENEVHEGDNPPIGILLCTKAGKKMVEYALAGMDNNLFVSTYLLQLPDKSVLEQFIRDNNVNNAKYNKTEI
jgi:predicted nuclease of restriction endonuclease-like (RecB) superfamily